MAISREQTASFGETLRQVRMKQGMSQRALAQALRLSPSVICLWENGRRVPDVEMMMNVARALNVSPYELLPGGGLAPQKYSCQWCGVPLEQLPSGEYMCPKCRARYASDKVHGALYAELKKSLGVLGRSVTPDRLARLIDRVYVGDKVKVQYTSTFDKQQALLARFERVLGEMELASPKLVAEVLASVAVAIEQSGAHNDSSRLEGLLLSIERALKA